MSGTQLRTFATEIRERIDAGRSSEGLLMAQYLLRRHPRYVLGYSLLAEAALEQGRTADAIEIFQRVLSADPESFSAHSGLAASYEAEGLLDSAIWHMLRAFEARPAMAGVRRKLRALYEQRDGSAPGRLNLSPAGLARTYLRDGWYDRAVDEFQRTLAASPDRVDLRAALMEALWRAGRRREAVEAAHQLLSQLPLCLKANLLLGQFYEEEGDEASALEYLELARVLDPENEAALRLFGAGAVLRPREVRIPSMEEAILGGELGAQNEPLPEWLADLSIFNADVDEPEQVDWEAIVAHEQDWRTRLLAAARSEVEGYVTDWRRDLRIGTHRSLASHLPEPAAAPWRDALREVSAGVLAAAAPVESAPWHAQLRRETDQALAAAPTLPFLPSPWQIGLRAETARALKVARAAPPSGPEVAALAWRQSLRAGTDRALRRYDRAEALMSEALAPTRIGTRGLAGAPPPWTSRLRGATDDALEARPAPTEARPFAGRRLPEGPRALFEPLEANALQPDQLRPGDPGPMAWVISLRAATGSEVARYTPRPEPAAPPPAPEWTESMRADSAAALDAAPPAPDVLEPVEAAPHARDEEPVEPVPSVRDEEPPEAWWEEDLVDTIDPDLDFAFTASKTSILSLLDEEIQTAYENEAARQAVTEIPSPGDEDAPVAPPPPEEPALPAAPVEDEFPTFEDLPDEEPVEEAAAVVVEAPPDELDEARVHWQSGRDAEALAIFARLADEPGEREGALGEALAAWAAAEESPAAVHQLLGDLYRRMGRLQDAVAHYREAISRR